MKTITLFSLKGGAGRTMLCAHLGAALARESRRALLVDLDPQNGLGHWFGMEPGERTGVSRRGLDAAETLQFIRRVRAEAPYLPFGETTEAERLEREDSLRLEPGFLKDRLAAVSPSDYDFLILDTPAGHTPWGRQALAVADLVLIVLQADPASYATVPATEDLLETYCNARPEFRGAVYVINQMDARRELSRDVKSALANLRPDGVFPSAVPYDEAVRDALGHRQTLTRRHPDSQVLTVVRQLATQLIDRLEADRPGRVIRRI